MSFPLTINLDLLINSFGGVGTSFVMHFFKKHLHVNCPHNSDFLKHIDEPPLTHKKSFRAIYIYGNPFEAVVSLFNRGYHSAHSQYLLRSYPEVQPILREDTLDNYLEKRIDKFKLEAHFSNWLESKRPYPILFIKYEYIWDYLPEIFDFVGIDRKHMSTFPKKKKRTSSLTEISTKNFHYLNKMYGTLTNKIEQKPAFFIKEASPETYFMSLIGLPLALIKNPDIVHPAIILSTFYPKTYDVFKCLMGRRIK